MNATATNQQESTMYTAGPICIDELITVQGQYDPEQRWNGWLCPRIDPVAVNAVMAALQAAEPSEAPSHRWEHDGTLILIETDGDDTYSETLYPDEDGLYALGAYAWVWSAGEEAAPLALCDEDDLLASVDREALELILNMATAALDGPDSDELDSWGTTAEKAEAARLAACRLLEAIG